MVKRIYQNSRVLGGRLCVLRFIFWWNKAKSSKDFGGVGAGLFFYEMRFWLMIKMHIIWTTLARWPKTWFSESGKCIGNLQPCEWCCVLACVFSRGARLCVSACGRLGVTNAQTHLIGRWGVTVWLAKARLSMRVPCEMSKPWACLWGAADSTREGCELFAWLLHNPPPRSEVGEADVRRRSKSSRGSPF